VNAQKAKNTIEKVQQLQRKLYLAAKKNSKRKFHALYDKLSRVDILEEAWKRVRANRGTGGIDGISISDVESYGVEKLLNEICQDLQQGNYQPKPVKRVFIPKADGKKRPLGIPVIRDRIVQMAAKIIIEPVFEADFKESSYGFRPKRSAHQALEVIRKACNNKGWWVVDADIQGYFDSINHDKLMKLVEIRINDRRILKLIRQWLKAGVMSEGKYEESIIGSPQGGVISPLLANIYLNYLDTVWEKYGQALGKLVRYADDFVIISRTKKDAEHALKLVKFVMQRLELTLHPEKTRLVPMWAGQGGFDFLGMHHKGFIKVTRGTQKYQTTFQFPSKKAMKKMRAAVKMELASRSKLKLDVKELVERINPKIRGWRNYYGLETAKQWLNKIDWYILQRFTIWDNKKRQKKGHYQRMSKVYQLLNNEGLLKLAG
jgi:RNA-directed DNA polymerase